MPQTIQRSFTAGEIAPALQSRADLNKYATGLNLCKNFFIRAQGGVYSRPGLRYIGELDDSTKVGRLIPFSFNTEQTYILVFEDLKMRVVKDGGFVLKTADITGVTQANPAVVTATAHDFNNGESVTISGVVGMTELNGNTYTVANATANTFELQGVDSTSFTAYVSGGTAVSDALFELVTSYTEAQLPRLSFTQSADVMTIVHPDHDPSNLSRLADDDWTLTAINYGSTVTAPTIATIAASGAGFGTFQRTYVYVVTAVDADGVESLASTKKSLLSNSLTSTGGIRLTWGAIAGASYYRVYKEPSLDASVYGWIGDSNTTEFTDFNLAPITSDAPPEDRQPFTGSDNKPSAVTYYQQRQVFANTGNEPQATYTTQVNNFSSLRTSNPARDDDAVTFTIAAQQVNEIRHLLPLDSLILLTSGGEWIMTEGQNRVLTPSTIGVRPQSYNGASVVPPVVINSTALYLQEKGARLRDLGYEFSSDKYTGNDLSLMSEHLFEGKQITAMAYAAEPYSIVWCVRDDGTMLGMTYQREHQVWGWHQHVTDGTFESVATITEGDRDALYVIVKRNINGNDVRYVERLESRESTNAINAFYVDSGLTYDGSPATIITGLDHLEGEVVKILADGYTVPDQTVTSGQIELEREASVVHVGLDYTPVIETLDIDTPTAAQTVKAQSVSVSKVTIEVEGTRGGFVGPRNDDGSDPSMREIKPRFDSDNYDAIALRTYKQEVYINPQWEKGGGVRIEQRDPLPMAVLSIIPQIDIGGN